MRICNLCRSAENPRGRLRFASTSGGDFCENCNPVETDIILEPIAKYVVIVCPDCRGSGRGVPSGSCNSCARYGHVRVKENALPTYIMKQS